LSAGPAADPEALADERRRVNILRTVVDLTCSLLCQERMSREEAERLVAATRQRVLELFPDKEATYELILAPRFKRLMDEFAGPRGGPKVLPFRGRIDS
jgi:hypothetical protein